MLHMYHQAAMQLGRCQAGTKYPQGNPEAALSCKAAMHLILAFQMFIRCPFFDNILDHLRQNQSHVL